MKKRKVEKKTPGLSFREAEMEVEMEGEGIKGIRCSISSETPYARMIWDDERGDYVHAYEVLGHGDGEVDCGRMKDGLVIQDTHNGDQVGIMRNPEVKDGKISGNIEFGCGERSQEIKRDAEAGIRRNMSVGYRVLKFKRMGDAEDGLPIYRAVKWQPYEASFVNVPADTGVGVGRSEENGEEDAVAPSATKTEERTDTPMEKPVETPVAVGVTADEVRGIVSEGIESLRAELTKKPEMPEAKRVEQFDEGAKKEIGKRYNIVNVIRSMVDAKEGKRSSVDVGFERECSQEIERLNHREAKGFFVPDMVLARAFDKGTYGANLVATDTLFGSMIEALVADTVLGKAGVRVLDGLVGDISIPKGDSVNAYWISSEGGNATAQTPTIGQVTGTPHTLGVYTDITRKLLNQGGISAQGFVSDALRSAIGRGIDAAGFGGTGSDGQPAGIENTASVGSVSMVAGAPTKANLVEFWEKLATANVNGVKKFIGSPAVKALLCKTLDYTAILNESATVGGVTSGHYLCENGLVEGYDFLESNLCGSKKLYFGDWSQMILAFWSGIDLTVDTSALSLSGGVRVVALQDCDVMVRHPKAFAIGTALS